MKHLFKPEVLKWLWTLLITIFLIKLLWFFISIIWLPPKGINHEEKKGAKSLYYRVKLGPNKAPSPVVKKKKKIPVGSIKDIKLLAIYSASNVTVVTVEHKKKTKVLGKGDTINGFTLEGATHHYATFSKNKKMYKVKLIIAKKGKSSIKKTKYSAKKVPKKVPKKAIKKAPEKVATGEVIDAGDHKIVDKSLITHYAKNLEDIYKDIGIKEIKKGKNLQGFSVSFIRRGSPFSKLGLKRGDIIKSINGQKIDSYNTAFSMYKNIGNIENLSLVIQRGKKEMELEYEVN